MTVEKLTAIGEFDQNPEVEHWEIELELTPTDPEFFDFMRSLHEVKRIQQIYPDEDPSPDKPYGLRVREITSEDGTVRHTAALKAESRLVPNGHRRRETPIYDISPECFSFYESSSAPRLFKDRIEPASGVSIDWIDGYSTPIIEIENVGTDLEAQKFFQQYRDVLTNRTGQKEVDNEWIARHLSKTEAPVYKQRSVDEMAAEIWGYQSYGVSPIVVTIDGRSGSGKSTVARELQSKLLLGTNERRLSCVLLSTDNYNRGKQELDAMNGGKPWTNFDLPEVYDTKALANVIARLRAGETVENRLFSFRDEAYRFEGKVAPAEVIIVEGIHAGTKDLAGIRHFHFPVTTSMSTSIGRDIDRFRKADRPNGSIRTTSDRLRYQLEVAEPTFRSIETVDTGELRRFRNTAGRKVVQMSGGKVVTRPKRSDRRTPAPLD